MVWENTAMVRTSAKAVIIAEGRILLIKRQTGDETWYTLPGGGQDKFEPLNATLARECREETGYQVRAGELMFVGEYIGKNHEFAETDSDIHQVDLHFLCEIEIGSVTGEITGPDVTQTGTEWVELGSLVSTPLYPKYLRNRIPEYLAGVRGNPYV